MREYTGRLNATKFCPIHKGQPISAKVHAENPEHWCYHCTTGLAMKSKKGSCLPTDFELEDRDYTNSMDD